MTKISDLLVSIVIPISHQYTDETIVGITATQSLLEKNYSNYEIVIIDSNLPRKENPFVDLLTEIPNLRYYRISHGSDIEICITAGLENAIGDVVVTLRPEEDPIELINTFVKKVASDGSVVMGLNTKPHVYPIWYSVGRNIHYRTLRHFIPERHPQGITFYMGLSRQAVNSILSIKYKSRVIRVFTSSLGFATEYIEYEQKEATSFSNKSFKNAASQSIDSVVMNSTKPLRYSAYIGLFAGLFNLAYMGYVFLVNLFKDKVAEGWTTNSLQNSIMFLFMFMMLTILSEYIDRLFNESKERPLYFVFEEKNSSIKLNTEQFVNVVRES